jgi:putative ABC transport system permease protein
MFAADILRFAGRSLDTGRMRTLLMALAMALGVAAVVVMTALGEGARRYVLDQFGSIGKNLVIVLPGRAETAGGFPGAIVGQTARDLTLDDALSLLNLPGVSRLSPLVVGTADVAHGAISRESPVLGTGPDMLAIRHMELSQGRFLPQGDLRSAEAVCVLGSKVREELFGARQALGATVRIGERRFRVIGVITPQGQQMGFNSDEIVMIPVAAAQQMFNTESLFRILVEARNRDAIDAVKRELIARIKARHENEEDVTVITQDAVLQTFDRIFTALTLAAGGIAAISLSVAGIIIMNVMLITVSARTREIGLLKALGAPGNVIRKLFFAESVLLSLVGAVLGLVLGYIGAWGLRLAYPVLPAYPPAWAVAAALGTALVTGVLFSLLPVRRAARLNPVDALAGR